MSNSNPNQQAGSGGREDRITAILRDPGSVFVYWRLQGHRSAGLTREFGRELRLVLRVLNLSDGGTQSIPVQNPNGNYYVRVAPGTTYGFELGARVGGSWRTICRTERMSTPPAPGTPPAAMGLLSTPVEEPSRRENGDRRARLSRLPIPGLHYEAAPVGGSSSSSSARLS